MKVILSTGLGRLFFINAANSINKKNIHITLIQGWLPNLKHKRLINILGKLIGRDNLFSGLEKRLQLQFDKKNLKSCSSAEFFFQFLIILTRLKIIRQNTAFVCGWKYFGYLSKRFINNANIFHVRSGAGRGDAISHARKMGMKIIVDQSAAHPAFWDKQLSSEYKHNNLHFYDGLSNPFWRMVLKDCYDSDILIVNSHWIKESFINEGFPEKKIKVAYLGVSSNFIDLKKYYNLNGPIKLLFTGNFSILKGAEYLLKALQTLDKIEFNYQMVVVGPNQDAKYLIEKYPVKNIFFAGFVPEHILLMHLADSDLYIFPSLCDGCASSGMEAMAAGLPVIATKESGLPIINLTNGIIIPSKNPEAIVNSIIKLKENHILRESIGKAAKKNIREKYTWEKYGEQVSMIYSDLLGRK